MYPILFKIPLFGGIPVYGYGVMIAFGVLLGAWFIHQEAIRVGADPNRALDLIFYLLLGGFVGSRILHIFVTDWDRFLDNPLVLFKIWEGGFVFFGGLISAIGIAFFYFKKYHLSPWKYCDLFVPAVALGHAFGRMGCFLAGCCHGRPVLQDYWFSVVFPGPPGLAPAGIPLYPTQLMESGAELLTFFFLFFWRRKKKFDGELITLYLMIYSLVRAVIEVFRGDLDRGFVIDPWLSTSQFISVFVFSVGLFFFIRNRRRGIS